jgi:hypothetical protein
MPTLGLRCAALAMSSALASACMSAPCNQARATFVTTPLPLFRAPFTTGTFYLACCQRRRNVNVFCAGVRAMHVHVGWVACEQWASRGSTHKILCLRGQSGVKVKVARVVHMYADSPWSHAFDAISPWVSFVRGDVCED